MIKKKGEELFFIPQPAGCTCLLTIELVLFARAAENNNGSPTEKEIQVLQNHTTLHSILSTIKGKKITIFPVWITKFEIQVIILPAHWQN